MKSRDGERSRERMLVRKRSEWKRARKRRERKRVKKSERAKEQDEQHKLKRKMRICHEYRQIVCRKKGGLHQPWTMDTKKTETKNPSFVSHRTRTVRKKRWNECKNRYSTQNFSKLPKQNLGYRFFFSPKESLRYCICWNKYTHTHKYILSKEILKFFFVQTYLNC